MKESQDTIADWARQAFGPAPSVMRVATRANEEMAELLRHAASNQRSDTIIEEAADVMIVLYRLAYILDLDLDLEVAVDAKMAVNRKREWKPDGTGHGYHVRAKRTNSESRENTAPEE